MFDKLKQMKQLKEIKDSLAQEKIETEKEGTKVVLNGNLEVEEIVLNPEMDKEKQEQILKDCFNEGVKKVQFAMAQKFQGMM